jgi:hypothetical protein
MAAGKIDRRQETPARSASASTLKRHAWGRLFGRLSRREGDGGLDGGLEVRGAAIPENGRLLQCFADNLIQADVNLNLP